MKQCAASLFVVLAIALVSGCGNCFEENTLVGTPEGLVPIGDLEVGDAVVSVDPSTGVESTARVARVSRAWAWCEKLVVDGRSVWLTEDHPIYSPEAGGFQSAESWLTGELHQTLAQDGGLVTTNSGSWLDQRPCRVVDLSVDAEPHTFVAAGIVVHNKSPPDNPCVDDEDCRDGYVCNSLGRCVPDDGAGGSSGKGGAGGQGGAGGR